MWVAEADIRDFFGGLVQQKLLAMVAGRVSVRRVLKLVRVWLEAGVMEDGVFRETVSGTPQGGVMTAPTQLRTLSSSGRFSGRGEGVGREM